MEDPVGQGQDILMEIITKKSLQGTERLMHLLHGGQWVVHRKCGWNSLGAPLCSC